MKIQKLTDIRTDILLLIGQTALFIVCILFIVYMYTQNIAPDKAVAEDFSITQCRVTDKGMAVGHGLIKHYRADFEVTYNAGGTEYTSMTSANGRDFSFTRDIDSQNEYLNEFEVTRSYPCWYNPSDPKEVVLVLRHSWVSTFPLILPSVISIVMLFYMIKTLTEILEIYMYIRNSRRK
jgi:hypothetical protein